MEKKNTTQVNLSEETSLYIQALKAIEKAEEDILTAFCETYGEEQGSAMTMKLPFETIRQEVSHIMGIVICDNQRDDKNLI